MSEQNSIKLEGRVLRVTFNRTEDNAVSDRSRPVAVSPWKQLCKS